MEGWGDEEELDIDVPPLNKEGWGGEDELEIADVESPKTMAEEVRKDEIEPTNLQLPIKPPETAALEEIKEHAKPSMTMDHASQENMWDYEPELTIPIIEPANAGQTMEESPQPETPQADNMWEEGDINISEEIMEPAERLEAVEVMPPEMNVLSQEQAINMPEASHQEPQALSQAQVYLPEALNLEPQTLSQEASYHEPQAETLSVHRQPENMWEEDELLNVPQEAENLEITEGGQSPESKVPIIDQDPVISHHALIQEQATQDNNMWEEGDLAIPEIQEAIQSGDMRVSEQQTVQLQITSPGVEPMRADSPSEVDQQVSKHAGVSFEGWAGQKIATEDAEMEYYADPEERLQGEEPIFTPWQQQPKIQTSDQGFIEDTKDSNAHDSLSALKPPASINPLDRLSKKPVSPIISNLTGWFSTMAEMTTSGMERLYENVTAEPVISSGSPSRPASTESLGKASEALHSLVKRAQQQLSGQEMREADREAAAAAQVPLPISPTTATAEQEEEVPLFGALSALERLGKSTATHAAALARGTIVRVSPAVKQVANQVLLLDQQQAEHQRRDLERSMEDLFEAMGAAGQLESYAVRSCEHARLMKEQLIKLEAAEYQRQWAKLREIRVHLDSQFIEPQVDWSRLLQEIGLDQAMGDLLPSLLAACRSPVATVDRILTLFATEDRGDALFQQAVLLYALRSNFIRLLLECLQLVIVNL